MGERWDLPAYQYEFLFFRFYDPIQSDSSFYREVRAVIAIFTYCSVQYCHSFDIKGRDWPVNTKNELLGSPKSF
jgi:hypothetical protein